MEKICKGIWHDHELCSYCNGFKGATPSKITTPKDNFVTCDYCVKLIKLEKSITNEILTDKESNNQI